MTVATAEPTQAEQPAVPFGEALRFWVYLGFINFGGPAGQIATMHKELVDRKQWISEPAYLRALNFCTLLPGPEAQQLATYIGWRLHGIKGGVVAGTFFVIPSIFVLLALSWLSVAHTDVPAIAGLFYGVQAVVIAIVVEAVVRIGKRALKHRALYAFAAAAFIIFGGAYAVLSYIAEQAVGHYGWLDTQQMVQGLGLAETTPGPLIMVTQYVGFVGAWNQGGDPRLGYAILGALVTTYVTFLPCFLFIFVGAPYIEALAKNRRLQAALVAITAAVVGVILNLAVFFARHVLFPADGGVDGFALALAVGAFLLAWRFHVPIHYLVLIGAVLGMVWTLAT